MGWVSVDEQAWKEHIDEIRDGFTWADAARRLALDSNWRLTEARWLTELAGTGLHPFDAYGALLELLGSSSMHAKVKALIKIIEMTGQA